MGNLKANPRIFSILFIKAMVAKIHTVNIVVPMACHLWPYTCWFQGIYMNLWPIFRSLGVLSPSVCTAWHWWPAAIQTSHHLSPWLSHTWAQLSVTQKQRDRGDTDAAATPMCWQHCWQKRRCCLPAVPSHLLWRTNFCFALWWPG